jgi:hypothetical protein
MMSVRNTNEAFGESGPFETESINALVEEYRRETLPSWAADAWMTADDDDSKRPALAGESREQYIERVVDELAGEFEDGLEIVE